MIPTWLIVALTLSAYAGVVFLAWGICASGGRADDDIEQHFRDSLAPDGRA